MLRVHCDSFGTKSPVRNAISYSYTCNLMCISVSASLCNTQSISMRERQPNLSKEKPFCLFLRFLHVEMIRLQLISGQGSRTTAVIINRICQKREAKRNCAHKHERSPTHATAKGWMRAKNKRNVNLLHDESVIVCEAFNEDSRRWWLYSCHLTLVKWL